MKTADVDGGGDQGVFGGFGAFGLWMWNSGIWTQLSAARVENLVAGDVDGNGYKELMADFGSRWAPGSGAAAPGA